MRGNMIYRMQHVVQIQWHDVVSSGISSSTVWQPFIAMKSLEKGKDKKRRTNKDIYALNICEWGAVIETKN